jgi:hypothetical protein
MPQAEFKSKIPAFELANTVHASDYETVSFINLRIDENLVPCSYQGAINGFIKVVNSSYTTMHKSELPITWWHTRIYYHSS